MNLSLIGRQSVSAVGFLPLARRELSVSCKNFDASWSWDSGAIPMRQARRVASNAVPLDAALALCCFDSWLLAWLGSVGACSVEAVALFEQAAPFTAMA